MESGYGRSRPSHDAVLTEVRTGTPAGELFPVPMLGEGRDLVTPVAGNAIGAAAAGRS